MVLRTKKISVLALLCALALVIGYFENLIPVFSVIPGGKIGLANTVTLVVFFMMGIRYAFVFGVMRSLLSSLMFSGFAAFFYSLAGTVLSIVAMWLSKKLLARHTSEIGISIIGAVAFNIGQLAVCAAVVGNMTIFRYLPVFLIISACAGCITGYIAKKIVNFFMLKNFKFRNGDVKIWK